MKRKENLLTFLAVFFFNEDIDKMNRKAEIHEQAIIAHARSWDLRMGIFILTAHPSTLKSEQTAIKRGRNGRSSWGETCLLVSWGTPAPHQQNNLEALRWTVLQGLSGAKSPLHSCHRLVPNYKRLLWTLKASGILLATTIPRLFTHITDIS